MIRVTTKIYLTIFCSLFFSCTEDVDYSNPKSVVSQYYQWNFENKYERQYSLLADTCKKYLTEQEFVEFCIKNESLSKKSQKGDKIINQLSIDPEHLEYRRFEIQYKEINKKNKDTIDIILYVTTYNENGEWKIVWTDNISDAAENLMRGQQFSDAIRYYNRALNYDPLKPSFYSQIGWCQYRQGYYDQALISAQKAIELQPERSATLNLIAGIYSAQDNTELAIETYKDAIEITYVIKEKKALLSNLASCYLENQNYSDAQQILNEVLDIDSTFTHAWWVKGRTYADQNATDSAIISFKKAIAFQPMDDFLQKNLYFDLAQAEHNFVLGTSLFSADRDRILSQAKIHILKALRLQPDDVSYRELLDKINETQ